MPGAATAPERYGRDVDSARLLEVGDDVDLVEYCYAMGWTDGLPVVAPTPAKVEAAIVASGRPGDDLVADYVERGRVVTVADVAVNAVLAGCRPEYLPVVLAIVEATTDPGFGIHAANATTGGSAVGFVVNGPVRERLGMNYRGNVLGPGNRANSTIGRAVRLTMINAFGSVPGAGNEARVGADGRPILDRATVGQPGKYACYHVVENEIDFPTLRPLHVERGHAPDEDVVTVFATAGHEQISVHHEHTSQEIVDTICHRLVGRYNRGGFLVLVIPPENADIFVRDGWTKADIRAAVHRGTTRTVAWVKENGHSFTGGLMDRRFPPVEPGDEQAHVAVCGSPDDVMVVVAGGPAGAFVHALFPYGGGMAERVVRTPKEGS